MSTVTKRNDAQTETEATEDAKRRTAPTGAQTKNQPPLAALILALLEEHPMHVYGMHKLMLERRLDHLVNIERRNSVQQVLNRLHREGHVETADGRTGRRIVYRITDTGRTLFYDWLHTEISRPRTEYPRFTAAVSLLGLLPPAEAIDLLAARRAELNNASAHLQEELSRGEFLPEVLTLEVDLRLTTTQAEIGWLDRIIARLESKQLTWDREDLLALSTADEPHEE